MTTSVPRDKVLPHDSHCPDCGSELERVHRDILDRWVSLFRSVHRYRCTDPDCGWEGLLGREPDVRRGSQGPQWRVRALWFLLGTASTLAAVEVARTDPFAKAEAEYPPAVQVEGAEAMSRATQPGLDFRGEPLPETDDRVIENPSPLNLRKSCAWGVPGGNRYRGTVSQALSAARLPPEVVQQVSEMVERGWVRGQVEISRAGIRTVDGSRYFGRSALAMGFGNTLCFNTRVNFKPGHTEYADLYEASDSTGKVYSVMVPYVCGNVAVLGERAEQDIPEPDLPEPSTWLIVLLGLGILALMRGRSGASGSA